MQTPQPAQISTMEGRLAALEDQVMALEEENAALREAIQLSGANLTIRAPGLLKIESGSTTSIHSSGIIEVKGSNIFLN